MSLLQLNAVSNAAALGDEEVTSQTQPKGSQGTGTAEGTSNSNQNTASKKCSRRHTQKHKKTSLSDFKDREKYMLPIPGSSTLAPKF